MISKLASWAWLSSPSGHAHGRCSPWVPGLKPRQIQATGLHLNVPVYSMCIYIYIYTHTSIYWHVDMRLAGMYIWMPVSILVSIYLKTNACTCFCGIFHKSIGICVHINVRMHIDVYILACTLRYAYTYNYIYYIYTCTYTCSIHVRIYIYVYINAYCRYVMACMHVYNFNNYAYSYIYTWLYIYIPISKCTCNSIYIYVQWSTSTCNMDSAGPKHWCIMKCWFDRVTDFFLNTRACSQWVWWFNQNAGKWPLVIGLYSDPYSQRIPSGNPTFLDNHNDEASQNALDEFSARSGYQRLPTIHHTLLGNFTARAR